MSMDFTYLDNNATTRPAPEVVESMRSMLSETWGNPSSGHPLGQRAAFCIQQARCEVAACIGAHPDEITFTSGGTESDMLAIRGAFAARHRQRHWITAETEHDAVITLGDHLLREGVTVTRLPADAHGQIDPGDLRRAIRPDTALVSLMLANNETGVLLPIADLAGICRERGVLFHTDAVQAVGKIPVNVTELGVDLLSLSSHKIHGPKGAGALYVRRGVELQALIVGGHQERDLRGGTENSPGIVGLGAAARLIREQRDSHHAAVRGLRDGLEEKILQLVPEAQVIGARSPRLPNTACIAFPGLRSEQLLLALAERGVYASGGSACHSGSLEPSRVLRMMGVAREAALGAVRFSLARDSEPSDVDRLLDVLPGILDKLQSTQRAGSEFRVPSSECR